MSDEDSQSKLRLTTRMTLRATSPQTSSSPETHPKPRHAEPNARHCHPFQGYGMHDKSRLEPMSQASAEHPGDSQDYTNLQSLTCRIATQLCCAAQGYEAYDKSKLEGTSEEDVQTKVRLTALMTLGTKSTHELQFAEVQKALGLASDNEVEAWVVRAIGKVQPFCSCLCAASSSLSFL